ncbi:MAG: sensor domain-containing diguanylate cyclase [Polyangiaceae bacterium]|nr:sensor domain-containing diguanylate cyclase [Myxococcales bacterium]MCB9587997.1 sensor domain-containing diguanylate cyclase [Polyangiaceae bacterium]
MDPLVRGALAVQQAIARSAGLAISLAAGALLVWSQVRVSERHALSWWWLAIVGAGLVVSLLVRLVRRLERLTPEDALRLDIELFTHLVVLAFGIVLQTQAGLAGPSYPAVYVLMMLAAAFARPGATVVIVLFTLGLEAAIVGFSRGTNAIWDQWGHAALLVAFASVNAFVFRAEIARVRRLSRAHIDSELDKLREAARTYRLLGPPSSSGARSERTSVRPGSLETDEERLVRSGVEEIHQALSLALDLLRGSLRARTAVLLWLDASGEKLRIHEISTSAQNIDPGPFSAKEGLFAAAFSRGGPVSLNGTKAGRHLPYYALVPSVGAACAVPVLERGQPRGMLVVDRPEKQPFTNDDEALLHEATRFFSRSIQNERVFIQLERAKVQQGKLYRAAELLAGATTEAQVIEHGVSSAREFASFDFAAVTLFDKSTAEHEICAVSGAGADDLVGRRFRHNAGLVGMVVENHHPLPYRGQYDPKRQVVFSKRLNPPSMPSLLVLPLLVHEKALGTLVLGSSQRGAFGDDARTTLEVLASHVAVSLANARMVKRLEELATTDGLTGLLNKRALIDTAGHMIRSAERFEKPVSVLVCDIDHFKKVNDTYGHDVGDIVIKGLGTILKRQKRDTDAVGRFGGEEFVVVCEETDSAGAILLAERVRTELEGTTFHANGHAVRCTCSVGVATFPVAGRDWDALFKATDEALYASKRGGRNRVTAWNPRLSGASAA